MPLYPGLRANLNRLLYYLNVDLHLVFVVQTQCFTAILLDTLRPQAGLI